MKKIISGIIMATVIGFASMTGASTAKAQALGVRCDALSGSPYMCVKNLTSFPIIGMQASSSMGFNAKAWINIPGGPIMPGETTIVKFSSWAGGCNQFVTIQTADMKTHTYPFVDVCHSVSFLVKSW